MTEESKEKQPSTQQSADVERKPTVAAVPPRPVAQMPSQTPVSRPPPSPPKPAQAPPPAPAAPKDTGRRNFVRAIFAVGAILSMIPFVSWGTFLSSTASAGSKTTKLETVVIDDESNYGSAAGKAVNVNDLQTFPPSDPAKGNVPGNGHWIFTYPTSGDLATDTQNPDTFKKYELIRLPSTLGGASKQATDFVAFSKVCVHLWCSPNYNPDTGHQQFECPCHGSTYRIPDGKAVAGPAALQAFPTNAIPMLTLQADSTGILYVVAPNRDPRLQYPNDRVSDIGANGELGFGRDFSSYNSFIKPVGAVKADLKQKDQVIS
jgi:rieske iron-sulfur protein